jgi:hypothetical protein
VQFTEPASNVPTNSLCFGLGNSFGKPKKRNRYFYVPNNARSNTEFLKNLMVRANTYFNNNTTSNYSFKGVNRTLNIDFLSSDDVRISEWQYSEKISTINAPVFQSY